MTDKKLTDNEIVKALEFCLDISPSTCKNCPLFNATNSTMVCSKIATKFALDLITRQQAEIDRLNKVYQANQQLINALTKSYFLAKSEAVKEFAERLNEEAQIADCFDSYNMVVGTHSIDNLLKEMVGEEE